MTQPGSSYNLFSTDPELIGLVKKESIKNIDDSYNNEWDILAELAQNSIDAIIKRGSQSNNTITIEFNCDAKELSFSDNGIGFEIDPNKKNTILGNPTLLDLNVTSKRNDSNQIGEKGVGLKFVVFNSNMTTIETSDGSKTIKLECPNFLKWKKGETDDLPKYELKQFQESDGNKFTKISVSNLSTRFDKLFLLRLEQLEYVLRTKTAIGRTNLLWGQEGAPDIKVNLIYTRNRNTQTKEIESKFHLLSEGSNDVIDYDDFLSWSTQADRTDRQKRQKLANKLIIKKGETEISNNNENRIIKFYTIFSPKRETFTKFSINHNLCSESELNDEDWETNYGYVKFRSGIEISSKGMPTGIQIPPPSTGYAGYWENIFMIYEDDNLVFDIGRKSVDGRSTKSIAIQAKKEFNSLLRTITRYITGDPQTFATQFDRVAISREIENLEDLRSDKSNFDKSPKDQEASVAAIFYELIGSGKIKKIKPKISGYKETYDLYCTATLPSGEDRFQIIEFKSKLKKLLPDLRSERKFTNELDCIVCYDVTEDEIEAFENEGYIVQDISNTSVNNDDAFPNATHMVSVVGAKNYWIIDLKKLL